jgi:putative membrane protein
VLCSDGEIAATIQALSEAEVLLVQAVRENFRDGSVAALADHMLTEHSLLLEQLKGEARAGKIAPAGCSVSRAMARAAGAERASLQMLSGASLDRAYVDREVLSHAQALALIEQVLAPAARNERIAFTIRAMRDVETQHEIGALAVQRALEGACGTSGDD